VFLFNLASANLFCVARPASASLIPICERGEMQSPFFSYLFISRAPLYQRAGEMHYLFWIIWVRAPRQPIYSFASLFPLSHIRL
jgi:hypothetical protein